MARRLFARSAWPETQYVASVVRSETAGGFLMLVAAATSIVWANVGTASYEAPDGDHRAGAAARRPRPRDVGR